MLIQLTNQGKKFFGIPFSPVLYSGSILSLLNILAGALGYLYQVMMGRFLPPAEFAVFSAMMALTATLVSPFGALVLAVSRKVSTLIVAEKIYELRALFLAINKKLFWIVLATIPFYAIILKPLQHYLKAQDLVSIVIVGAIVVISAFSSIALAFLQGMKRFMYLGLNGILIGLCKIIFSGVLVYFGLGVVGGIAGVALSYICLYCLWFLILSKIFITQKKPLAYKLTVNLSMLKGNLPVLISSMAIVMMTQSDVILVNWFYPGDVAGIYAAASILGKAIFYLPGGLVLAMYPMVSEGHASGSDTKKILIPVLQFGLGIGFASCFFYAVFGGWIINIFYGDKYSAAGTLLRWYGFMMLPYIFVLVAEQYLIAKRRVLYVWLFLLMCPFQVLAVFLWHSELWMVMAIVGISGLVLALLGAILMKVIK